MATPKIKKAYASIHALLVANTNEPVSSILDEATALMSAKSPGSSSGSAVSTAIFDTEGNVLAIKDYYFKRWMPIVGEEAVEFGKKASSATGFSNMSKEGTSLWTKQQREASKANEQILVDVEAGKLDVGDIAARREEIEAKRVEIADTTLGFSTEEEVIEYLTESGYEVATA